ncbi:MAG: hypothetical protein ABIJ45_08150, partial [Candidatus Zixiibacteriota bacterium]
MMHILKRIALVAVFCFMIILSAQPAWGLYPADGAIDVPQPIAFQWNPVSGAMTYQFWIDYNGGTTSYGQPGFTPRIYPSGTYVWKYRAYYYNPALMTYVWSDWTSEWSFTCLCAVPDQPILTSPSDGSTEIAYNSITLYWENVTYLEAEHIQVDNDNDFSSPEFDWTGHTGYPNGQINVGSLNKGTEYFWRVEYTYTSTCGYSDWSEVWSFTTDCPILNIPTQTTPADEAIEQSIPLVFAWDAIAGTENYYLQIDDDPDFNSPEIDDNMIIANSTEITSGLNNGETYYWRIQAGDLCGWSGWSPVWSFEMACPLPELPTLASPVDMASDIPRPVLLDWDDVAGAVTYHVQVDEDPGFGSPDISEQFTPGQSEYLAEDLVHETIYYWRVRAQNACGWGNWSGSWQFTTSCPSPDIPNLENPLNGTSDVATLPLLEWKTVAEAVMYQIQVDDDPGFATPEVDGQLTWTSVYAPNLNENSAYYWRIRALNYCTWGEWSSAFNFTTGTNPKCGDVNQDNVVNILDITYTISIYIRAGQSHVIRHNPLKNKLV